MNMSDFHLIFVHGYKGSSRTDWFPAISKLLREKGISHRIPDMPGGLWNRYPNGRDWERILGQELKEARKQVILVGYSLGTRAVLNYIQNHDKKFGLVILISPPNNNPLLSLGHYGAFFSFFFRLLDIPAIRKRVKRMVVVTSEDDPSVPHAWSKEIARELGAEIVTFADKGHINSPRCAEDVFAILTRYVSRLEKREPKIAGRRF